MYKGYLLLDRQSCIGNRLCQLRVEREQIRLSVYVLKSILELEASAGCCDMSRLETSSATRPCDV